MIHLHHTSGDLVQVILLAEIPWRHREGQFDGSPVILPRLVLHDARRGEAAEISQHSPRRGHALLHPFACRRQEIEMPKYMGRLSQFTHVDKTSG